MIMPLELLVNPAAGQIKTIDNNKVISTGLNQITLAAGSTLSPIPSVNDRYEIIPRISIAGNGINAEAYAIMDSSSLRISRIAVKIPVKIIQPPPPQSKQVSLAEHRRP